jgi:hypothetical protein
MVWRVFCCFVVMGVTICLKKIPNKNINLFSWIKGILLCICRKIDIYEQLKKKPINKKWFFVSVKDDGIYLNNIKIIDKKAELQFAIFKILIDLYIEEFFAGKLKFVTIPQIRAILESQKIFVDDEKQIRTAIYYIRTSTKAAHRDLKTDSIIESQKWKGYRLCNNVFLGRF